ncbi:MAG: hypothetical protein HKN26_10620 [Acidimicrobiales bacterium]|nr:hypothetical protein [Acidimicrobiales bacterium]
MATSLALIAALVVTPAAAAHETEDGATRHLTVIADSIVLGAAEEIPAAMPDDWVTAVDAEVSRSTSDGLATIRSQRGQITDTLVIGLGANDGGSPALFRPRVEALLAEVADVPHVYWIEIAEVRSYYPSANAVVRDVAAQYDNVEIIPWGAQALADPGLTGTDGLHLTSRGQQAMADLIVATVTAPEPEPPAPAPAPSLNVRLYRLLLVMRASLY